MPTFQVICAGCGGSFETRSTTAGTCSSACRQRAYRRRVAAERKAAAGFAEQFPGMVPGGRRQAAARHQGSTAPG